MKILIKNNNGQETILLAENRILIIHTSSSNHLNFENNRFAKICLEKIIDSFVRELPICDIRRMQ